MGQHIVKQGEYVSKIAKQYGFADHRTIWDHPDNAALKGKRQNPNILLPGDRLHIPDKQAKEESGATQQQHRFQVTTQNLKLRIVLKDVNDQPIANTQCELEVDGEAHRVTTNGDGLVEREIPKTAERGKVTGKDTHTPIEIDMIKIGYLDPVDERSGQLARLANLGYYVSSLEQPDEAQLRSAIEEFQCDHRLTVDGVCGSTTQAKLRGVHGC